MTEDPHIANAAEESDPSLNDVGTVSRETDDHMEVDVDTEDLPSYKAFAHSYLAQAEDPDTEDQFRLVYATIAQVSATMALVEAIEGLVKP